MFLCTLDLTTALRPELLPDETLLFVQDAVGLYEGKYKIPGYQHGHVYLTSHRVCYVDNVNPRSNSTAIGLKDVERYEFYAGFLKSSPKITLHPKPCKGSSIQVRGPHMYDVQTMQPLSRSATASPIHKTGGIRSGSTTPGNAIRTQTVTWVCPICSFSNTLPQGFDVTTANDLTPLPPCQACGIKPPLVHVLKAAIAGATGPRNSPLSSQPPDQPPVESYGQYNEEPLYGHAAVRSAQRLSPATQLSLDCPRCTFRNHPSLMSCEICGASLTTKGGQDSQSDGALLSRSESPGPLLDNPGSFPNDVLECAKISFRAGGEKVFYERLKGAMVQRKWLLQNAPPVPQPQHRLIDGDAGTPGSSGRATPEPRAVGIAGLERLGLERRRNNETVISSAFEDLEALMTSAKEIIALAESFAEKSPDLSATTLLQESAAALGMTTTKDMLGSSSGSDALYLTELARNLAEFLTDDRRAVLRKAGGILSLVDLWAALNRARNGVELVSPADFVKASRLWGKLGLPVRLREFRNGLLVVQPHDWTDDKTVVQLLAWLQEFHIHEPREAVHWDWRTFGKGVTAQETAARFGWSVGVATQELEMAEERGMLCREEGIEGVRFWENWFLRDHADDLADGV